MSQFRWLFAVAGALVGVMALTLAHNVKAQIQPRGGQILPPRTVIKVCDVSPSFGALRGVWGEWLLFEDAAGSLRSVDGSCGVRHMIRRQ